MGKLRMFAIVLNKDVVMAGETFAGRVVIDLSDTMKMRGIHLRFWGKARVHWTETEGSGKTSRTNTYSAQEDYYDQHLILFGKPQGQISGENPQLPAGHYEYPFSFQLPPTLPPSVEFQYGVIRHQLQATIDRPWKLNRTVTRPFTLIAHYDLNYDEVAKRPTQGSKNKELGCCCCVAGELAIDCRLDRTGYVPGEYIVPKGRLENNSSRLVDRHRIRLIQLISFQSTVKTRQVQHKMAEVVLGKIQPFSSADLESFHLLIPPCPASGLAGCSIMDLDYSIQMEMDPSGPSLDLELPLAIRIGTIPLQQVQCGFASAPYNPQWHDTSRPDVQPPPPAYTDSAPSAPPPSYIACMGQSFKRDDEEKKAIEHGADYSAWAPAYTYYTWGSPDQVQGGEATSQM